MKEFRMFYSCDRCNKEASVTATKEKLTNGKEILSADLPEGWGTTPDGKDLCPDCLAKYEDVLGSFYKNDRSTSRKATRK